MIAGMIGALVFGAPAAWAIAPLGLAALALGCVTGGRSAAVRAVGSPTH